MSLIQSRLDSKRFYRSLALPCPYLPGRMERKLFTRLEEADGAEINALLTQAGFRRSHDIVYRPVCESCAACVPVRIPVALHEESHSLRRIRRRNADLTVSFWPAHPTPEQYALFLQYQEVRHTDGDMAQMSWSDYASMVEEGTENTCLAEWRLEGRLMAVMLLDRVGDGLSAVYSFFDPAETRRSLGTLVILGLVDEAVHSGAGYVYLGYLIRGTRKMEYKARFRPLEGLGKDGWMPLPDEPAI